MIFLVDIFVRLNRDFPQGAADNHYYK